MKKLFVILIAVVLSLNINTLINATDYNTRHSSHLTATQPEPRTFSTQIVCTSFDLDYSSSGYQTYPYIGCNVDGARAILLIGSWDGFTGKFDIEPSFVNSVYDTMMTTFPIERITIDSVYIRQEKDGLPYDEGFSYVMPANGGMFQGFLKFTIHYNEFVDVENLDLRVVVMY